MPSEQTRRRRRFGQYMQALRERVTPRLTPEAAAKSVETSRATISRLEGGKQLPNVHLVYAVLGLYGATEEERDEAMVRWRAAKASTITIEHAADLAPKYAAFRRDESEAITEWTLDYATLPGLVQTSEYIAALVRSVRHLPANREQPLAEERQARQALLHDPEPLRLHSLISEFAIRCLVGGPDVMAEQLRRLLDVGAKPNVTIQVVPYSAGAFGPMGGPVIILGYDDSDSPHSVYLDYAVGGESIESQSDVSVFVAMFEDIKAKALPSDQSAELIRAVLEEIEVAR
jgi:DNA-binding XRE family transcriptional regulator